MPKYYRALISVPITADDDDAAASRASDCANSLVAQGSTVIIGHVERLVEVSHGGYEAKRVVFDDPGLWRQLL